MIHSQSSLHLTNRGGTEEELCELHERCFKAVGFNRTYAAKGPAMYSRNEACCMQFGICKPTFRDTRLLQGRFDTPNFTALPVEAGNP